MKNKVTETTVCSITIIITVIITVMITIIIAIIIALTGCSLQEKDINIVNAFNASDPNPPKLVSAYSTDENTVRIIFDESVVPVEDSFLPYEATSDGFAIDVKSKTKLSCSKQYTIKGRVKDCSGNSTRIEVKIQGYNPNPAGVLINEISTKGQGKQPDRTELIVKHSGNTGGLTVYDGIPGNSRNQVTLDSFEVNQGDFIVIWWTEALPDGVKEHPADNVFNVCANSETNPSENNGIQTVALSPSQGDRILDCVVYSSFESAQYEGFGTKEVYERVSKALESKWWSGEAATSQGSTSTRTINRTDGKDTGSSADWFICATGKSSFGKTNSTERY